MKLLKILTIGLVAAAASSAFADNVTSPLDLSVGNARFGRDNAVGSFSDTYTFSIVGMPYFLTSTASSAASGDQDLDFTSLVIQNAASVTLATYAGNLGNDANEFYALNGLFLVPGDYKLVITGLNSPTQASYSGNIAISAAAVPEPETYALMLAGLGAVGFVARRRKTV